MATTGSVLSDFSDYTGYASAGSFWGITEEGFLGYLVAKSSPVKLADKPPKLHVIKNSLLPNNVATLVASIKSSQDVIDHGYTNADDFNAGFRNALSSAPANKKRRDELFKVADKYAKKTLVAKVPKLTDITGTVPAKTKDTLGEIRSAHCDNNRLLGEQPKYKFNPDLGPTKKNLYYLWIELLTSFDKNQRESLQTSGLWSAIDGEGRAVERISYVEYTAGVPHSELPVPKARLVYDYNNDEIYITVHYDTPNHKAYLESVGIKPYFKINKDADTGTDSLS